MANGNETVKIMEEEQQALEDLKNEVSDAENFRELTNEVTKVKSGSPTWAFDQDLITFAAEKLTR